jgi:hypothetical protein
MNLLSDFLLLSIREGEVTTGPNPHELLERNQYLAPKSLVNAIRASDTTLQEWQVRYWDCKHTPTQTPSESFFILT